MAAGDRLRLRLPARHWPWSRNRPLTIRRAQAAALGLRGRIVGAVLVTTVATLAVAALALLGPLEQSLRNAAKQTLRHDLQQGTIRQFKKLRPERAPGIAGGAGRLSDQPLSGPAAAVGTDRRRSSTCSATRRPTAAASRCCRTAGGNHRRRRQVRRRRQGVLAPTARSTRSGPSTATEYARAAIPFTSGGAALRARRAQADRRDQRRGERGAHGVHHRRAGRAGADPDPRRSRCRRGSSGACAGCARPRWKWPRRAPRSRCPVDRARDEVGDLARTLATMQQRLRQQEEARRSFVATASHELRTPLTSLDGMLELLDDDLRYDQPRPRGRARAAGPRAGPVAPAGPAGRRPARPVAGSTRRVALRSEPVELGELSRAVLAEFELGTAERGIETELDDHGGSVWALGDPGSVARILRILLDNAVRVSPPASSCRSSCAPATTSP